MVILGLKGLMRTEGVQMSDDRERREIYTEQRLAKDCGPFLSIPVLPLFSDVPVDEYSVLMRAAEDQLAWAYEERRLALAKVWRDERADP
jgi:hypothetical protein